MNQHLLVCLGVSLALGGCSTTRSRGIGAEAQARDSVIALVMRELTRQLAGMHVAVRLDSSRIEWRDEASRVVPGLAYHWASYRPVDMTHVYAQAFAAHHGTAAYLIRDADDWSVAAGDWRPATAAEAQVACLELARSAGRGRDPELLAIPVSQARSEIGGMPPELCAQAARALKDSVVVSAPVDPNGRWVVEMWVFEKGRTTQYRCGFGSAGHKAIELTPIDSIEGVGWFTTEATGRDSG